MGRLFAFLTLVAGFVFAMGIITHPKDTASVVNSMSSGLVSLLTLELGTVPKKK
jgi:hypothetical protein